MRHLPAVPPISRMYLPGRRVLDHAGRHATVVHAAVHPRPSYTVVYDYTVAHDHSAGGSMDASQVTAVRPDTFDLTSDTAVRIAAVAWLTDQQHLLPGQDLQQKADDLLAELDLAVFRRRHTYCRVHWTTRYETVGCGFYVEPGDSICGFHQQLGHAWFPEAAVEHDLRLNPVDVHLSHGSFREYRVEYYTGLLGSCVQLAHHQHPDAGVTTGRLAGMLAMTLAVRNDAELNETMFAEALTRAKSRGLLTATGPGSHLLYTPSPEEAYRATTG